MISKYLKIQFLLLPLFSFSQIVVEYGGKIEDASGKEYLIILTDVDTPTNSFTKLSSEQKFNFKNIPIGKYKRCITTDNFAKCDTIDIKENLTNESLTIEKEKKISEVVISNQKPLIQNKNGVLEINIKDSPILSNRNSIKTTRYNI